MGATYIQHKPHVGNGKHRVIDYCDRMARDYPGKRVEFVSMIAEGDHVVLRCQQRWRENHDYAGIDIFRIAALGKVVEQWDVLQVLPESSANKNGMVKLMSSPDELRCLCYWSADPGQTWQRDLWLSLRARLHQLHHWPGQGGHHPAE